MSCQRLVGSRSNCGEGAKRLISLVTYKKKPAQSVPKKGTDWLLQNRFVEDICREGFETKGILPVSKVDLLERRLRCGYG
jgi:hypothetical protein